MVSIGSSFVKSGLTRVTETHVDNLREAWNQMRMRNHQRICFLTWDILAKKNYGAWLGAYYHCQRECPKKDQLPAGILPEMTLAAAQAHIEKTKPDAVFSENSGLINQVRSVFPDLACYTLDQYPDDGLSGINVRRKEIGQAVADTLIDQLARGIRGLPQVPKTIMIDGEWLESDRKKGHKHVRSQDIKQHKSSG